MAISVGGECRIVFRDFAMIPSDEAELRQFVVNVMAPHLFQEIQSIQQFRTKPDVATKPGPSPDLEQRGVEVSVGIRF